MHFIDLGLIPFAEASALQNRYVREIARGERDETLLLLEHPHVFTMGRRGLEENVIADRDFSGGRIEVERINRGGDVTYHGPGQLVGYPHLDLRRRGRDLHALLRNIEEILIRTARRWDIAGYRREGLTGVWTDAGKLASIGIGVRQWITMHGFALNVNTDLRYFGLINPCGIPSCEIASLWSLTGDEVDMGAVKIAVQEEFQLLFGH